MTPTLGAALLSSSRAAADLGQTFNISYELMLFKLFLVIINDNVMRPLCLVESYSQHSLSATERLINHY